MNRYQIFSMPFFIIVIGFMLLSIYGCTPEIQRIYVPVAIYPNPKPVLPTVSKEELECLDSDVTERIYKRVQTLIDDDNYLRKLIEKTNGGTND